MVGMLGQEEMRKGMSKLMGYDVQNFEEPATLSRSELEELGREAQFEYAEYGMSEIKMVRINNKYWFGLYEFFTILTQHCYCNRDDIYYILGMVKYVKDNQGKSFNTFYSETNVVAMTYARFMEYVHMKMIYKELYGENWVEQMDNHLEDMDILYKKIDKEFHVGNYFYFYRMYIYNMISYEMLLGIKNNITDRISKWVEEQRLKEGF